MKRIDTLRQMKPLFHDPAGYLVLGRGHKLYRRSTAGVIERLAVVPESKLKIALGWSKLTYRLARLGFGCGAFFKGMYFFCHGGSLYRFCPATKALHCELRFRVGRGPLSFGVIENVTGFEDGIFFGEYFGNRQRAPVNVFKRSADGTWGVVFTFAAGQINHVHAVVADPQRGCVWVLAGDFEHSASIWLAEREFESVQPVLRGEQSYRACVAFPLEQGLLYATDTQLARNSIRLLQLHNGEWVSRALFELNGSCIYGSELLDYFVFSTATEPSDDISNKYLSLFDRAPGPGIIENKSDVVAVKKSDLSCAVIISKQKDFLPYRLFQFGAIHFPQGISPDNSLYAYTVANKGNDLCTEVYNLE